MDLNIPAKVSYAHLLGALSRRLEEGHEPEDKEYFNDLASTLYQGYCQDQSDLEAARRARAVQESYRQRLMSARHAQASPTVINLHFFF